MNLISKKNDKNRNLKNNDDKELVLVHLPLIQSIPSSKWFNLNIFMFTSFSN